MSVQVMAILARGHKVAQVVDLILSAGVGMAMMLFAVADYRLEWILLLAPMYGIVRLGWLLSSSVGRRWLLVLVPTSVLIVVGALLTAPARSRWMLRWDLDIYGQVAERCRSAVEHKQPCDLGEAQHPLVRFARVREESWGRAVWMKPRYHYVYLVHVPDPSMEARALQEERCARPFERGWVLVYRC